MTDNPDVVVGDTLEVDVTIAVDDAVTVVVDADPALDVSPAPPGVVSIVETDTTVVVNDTQLVSPTVEPPAPFTVVTISEAGPQGQTGPPGYGTFIAGEFPTGVIDGSNRDFLLAHPFQSRSTNVFLNGLCEPFYAEQPPQTIQFSEPPRPGDTIMVNYTVSSG